MKKGENIFKKDNAEAEKRWNSEAKKGKKENDIYSALLFKLEPQKGMFDPGVFHFYIKNEEKLGSIITERDKARLKKLIIESVFEKFNPGEQRLTITDREGERTGYRTHSYIHIFGDCLRVAKLLGMDISKYRQRIINYIPFAYHEQLQAIFSLVPNPMNSEITTLLKTYNDKRDDDLQTFMPVSFISACEKYGIVGAIPILKRFVDDPKLLLQYRASALAAIAAIQADEKY